MVTSKKVAVVAKQAKSVAAVAPTAPDGKPAADAGVSGAKPIAKAAPQATKPAVKSADSARQPQAKATATPRAAAPVKPKKPKLVRDSFTIPKAEYTVLENLKQRAARLSRPAKKSEMLRAGIKALAAMPDTAFLAALKEVPAIKTGRPIKS